VSPFDLVALLLFAAAVIGYANERWIGLPPPICLLLGAIATSLAVMALDPLFTSRDVTAMAREALRQIDFPAFLMDGVLAFLLFAAALHVRIDTLRSMRWTIFGLATAGVIISTGVFGVLLWIGLRPFGTAVPLGWCLVLGAMLAPTDAVVVEGLLRRVDLAPRVKAAITGESLFNDGAGVVIFLVAVDIAQGATGIVGHGIIAGRLLAESAGGAALGVATGLVAEAALRRASATVSLTISLALVLVTYRLAQAAGVSGPIAVVAAGLLLGNRRGGGGGGGGGGMAPEALAFWGVLDSLLNAMLFLLIGFETFVVAWEPGLLAVVALSVPLALLARAVSVAVPVLVFGLGPAARGRGIAVLTWAGLRGGVSVALALGLPASPHRSLLITACYAVVVFSIVVQGLSMPAFIRRVTHRQAGD
jgi:CPA1 family monovalent cation:H+ antiporter